MYLAPAQPPRQRLPSRVYATRRVVAAITTVAVLFLTYSVASAVFGGPDRHTDAAPAIPSTALIVSDGKTPLTGATTRKVCATRIRPGRSIIRRVPGSTTPIGARSTPNAWVRPWTTWVATTER